MQQPWLNFEQKRTIKQTSFFNVIIVSRFVFLFFLNKKTREKRKKKIRHISRKMIRFLTSSRQYKLSKSFIFHFLFITFGLLFQPRMFLIRWRFLFWVCFLYFQIVAEEIETQTRTFTLPCQRKRRENHLPHTVSRLNSHSAPISGTILLHIVSNCSSCHSLREKEGKGKVTEKTGPSRRGGAQREIKWQSFQPP